MKIVLSLFLLLAISGAQAQETPTKEETTLKIEMNQAEPSIITPEEGMTEEEKIALDNKKRQKAILNEITDSSGLVKSCITKNNKIFRGTHITLVWVISPDGKVQNVKIKSTDINDLDIRDCIKRAAALFDFNDAVGHKSKKSEVEFTYKFKDKN